MRNCLRNINWYSTNLVLRVLSVAIFLVVVIALLVPSTQKLLLGFLLSWSGLLAFQIFRLPRLPDAEPVNHNPTIQLHLR